MTSFKEKGALPMPLARDNFSLPFLQWLWIFSCPYVRPLVRPHSYSNDEYGCFEGENSLIDIKNNSTMSDDEVVASWSMKMRVDGYTICSVGPSKRSSQVEPASAANEKTNMAAGAEKDGKGLANPARVLPGMMSRLFFES